MHRRDVLALCGAGLGGLAGCLSSPSRSDEGQTTASPTRRTSTAPDTSSPTATPSDVELTVELDALQPALVVLNVDYFDLYSNASSQYLYVRLSVSDGSAPSLSDLSFRFDGESHAPVSGEEIPQVYRLSDSSAAPRYTPEEGRGWLLFELPATGDASDAALVWPGGEWRPDGEVRSRLAAPSPPLSVERWEVPSTVAVNGRTTFRLAVKNAGDVAGQFVGGVNANGWYPHRPIAALSRRIPPGETVSWDVPGEDIEIVTEGMDEQVGDGEADVDYELVWPGGTQSKSVRVVDAETTTE